MTPIERADYLVLLHLVDGRYVAVLPLIFGGGRLGIGPDLVEFTDVW